MYNVLGEIMYWLYIANLPIKYENIRYYCAYGYLSILKLTGIRIYQSGEPIRHGRSLWISNHRSKLDGIIIQTLLCVSGNDTISVVKDSIRQIPIFGSFGTHCRCLFIRRDKTAAAKILEAGGRLSRANNWSVLIFPEGTTMSPYSQGLSHMFSEERSIDKFERVLFPKTTGFNLMKQEFETVGNITISYGNPSFKGNEEHSFPALFRIFPHEVYIHIKYVDTNVDLMDVFREKDLMLEKAPVKRSANNYRYSCLALLVNMFGHMAFLYCLYASNYFRYLIMAITIFACVRTIIQYEIKS